MTSPECKLFGTCGGCKYQDIPYIEELTLKSQKIRDLLSVHPQISEDSFAPIVASPQEYHTRHRLDLTFIKTKEGEHLMGFFPPGYKKILEIEACPISHKEISKFLPQLKEEAITKIPKKYKRANLTIRCGDDGRLAWGGMGRGSLKMESKDYLWTEQTGLRIHYAMETFFQANLYILPSLIKTIRDLAQFPKDTIFLDLYAGVGLWGLSLAADVSCAILIEDNKTSHTLAKYNIEFHGFKHVKTLCQRVDDSLADILRLIQTQTVYAMINPPRKGLHASVAKLLSESHKIQKLFYLSCDPNSLSRDLEYFLNAGWTVKTVVPFDFFPKTHHIETLVFLESPRLLIR